MELSSDSDDCQLYTRAAQNVCLKKKNLQERLEECEKIINLLPEQAENVLSNFENSRSDLCNPCDILAIRPITEESEEEPLATRNLRSRRKKSPNSKSCRPKNPRKRKSAQVSDRRNEHLNVSESPFHVENFNISKRTRRWRQRNRSSNAEALIDNIITFDDDTGYSTSISPINFNKRKKTQHWPAASDDISNNISLTSILISDDEESFESDSLYYILTVEWNNGKKTARKEFKLRRYQKLETVFEELANLEGLPTNRILLMHDFNSLRPSDTPSSLKLNFYSALTGTISRTEINHNRLNLESSTQKEKSSEGVITVKLQFESGKVLPFSVVKHQKVGVLYKMCCEELKCDESQIKINFDGEFVEPDDLLSELEVEDGDLFHVYIRR